MITFRSKSVGRRSNRVFIRSLIGVGLLLIGLVAARLLVVRSFDSGPLPPNLSEVANLPVMLTDGSKSTLGSRMRPGLPTLVSVWANWCGPCRKEAPVLVGLRSQFGPEKLNFVYLNGRDPTATPQELIDFVESVGLKKDAIAIADAATLSTFTRDTTNLIPRTYLFDGGGRPIAMIVGYKPLALARIEGLLK